MNKIKSLLLIFSLVMCWTKSWSGESPFHAKSYKPHRFKILHHGLHSLNERIELIESAKESIEVEYFIYNTDRAGKILTHALIKKALEGTKVRVLLDYFMTQSTLGTFHSHELRKAGVEVRYYNTVPMIRMSAYQYRNHRKSVIVDGKKAIVGGRNVGDEYFDLDHTYNFLDRDVLIEGPIVETMREAFNIIWESDPVKKLERPRRPTPFDAKYTNAADRREGHRRYKRDLKNWKDSIIGAKRFLLPTESHYKITNKMKRFSAKFADKGNDFICNEIEFVSDKPGIGAWTKKSNRVVKYVTMDYIRSSSSEVIIDSPYFILDPYMSDTLATVANNGAKMKLLTNSLASTDAVYVQAVFNTEIENWFTKNMNPYLFRGKVPGYYGTIEKQVSRAQWGTHSKSFVIDDQLAVISSYNMDPRSNNYNLEQSIICHGNSEIAFNLKNNILNRMESAIHVTSIKELREVKYKEVGLFKRITYALSNLPAEIFDFLL